MSTACAAPLLLGLAGGAMDLYIFQNHRNELQNTADAAVLAAASEAGLKGWNQETAKQIVGSIVDSNLTGKFSGVSFAYDVTVDQDKRRIEVDLSQDHYGYFVLGYFTGSPQIAVKAAARASGQATLCVIVQNTTQSKAFEISGHSTVQAIGCSAYSNSASSTGIQVKDNSRLVTQLSCSVGGYAGKFSNFAPVPLTDCPSIEDPLATRASLIDDYVASQTCGHNKLELENEDRTLQPGVYCGGLTISKGSNVTLKPGIYVIEGGKLKLDESSSLSGDGVAFVFRGEASGLNLKHDSTISLSAPTEGPMAGILMYAEPVEGHGGRNFKIESQDAQKLIGTVYLPADTLMIGGDKDGDGVCDAEIDEDGALIPAEKQCLADIGATSSWTAIVARSLKVTAGSRLVLNSDYTSSDIPVPEGIGPNSTKVRLIR